MQERGRQHKQAPEREGECTLKNGKKTNCFQIENQILFFSSFCALFAGQKSTKKQKKKNKIRKDWKTKRKETEQQQQNSINSTLILIRHLPVP